MLASIDVNFRLYNSANSGQNGTIKCLADFLQIAVNISRFRPFLQIYQNNWATGYRQIWSTVAGYEEIPGEFQPIKNGDVFGMNNTVFLFLFIQNISPFPIGWNTLVSWHWPNLEKACEIRHNNVKSTSYRQKKGWQPRSGWVIQVFWWGWKKWLKFSHVWLA